MRTDLVGWLFYLFTTVGVVIGVDNLQETYLRIHNEFRAKLVNGTVENQPQAVHLPALVWDLNLERQARSSVFSCYKKPNADMVTGENLGITADQSQTELKEVRAWLQGRNGYKHGPILADIPNITLAYTQMIWEHTRFIGCARTFCANLAVPNGIIEKVYFSVCKYSPRGNILNEVPYVIVDKHPDASRYVPKNPNSEYFLRIHNDYRKLLRLGKVEGQPRALSLPDMKWNATLAEYAVTRAKMCVYNLQPTKEEYGENMGFTSARRDEPLHDWFLENKNYRFQPIPTDNNEKYLRYTQMIWYKSTKLGCSRQLCKEFWYNGQWNKNVYLTVCEYYEKGNQPFKVPYEADLPNRGPI